MTMTPATLPETDFGDLQSTPGREFQCRPCGSDHFRISVTPFTEVVGFGATSQGVSGDLVTVTESSVSTRTSFNVSVDAGQSSQSVPPGVVVSVTDQSVASPVSDGKSTGLSSGETYFVATAPGGEVSASKVKVEIKASTSFTYRSGYVDGTLRHNAFQQIESRTAGKGRECLPLWSTRNVSSQTYVWNTECWAADIENKTCISPWNSATGGGGVLVSPRHMLTCQHLSYYPKPGAKVHFVRPDGTTDVHTVEAVVEHPYSVGLVTCPWDVVALKLDRDVHPSIKFAKVLPQDHRPWIPTGWTNQMYPPVTTTQTGEPPTLRSCHMTKRFGLALSYNEILPFEPIPYYRGFPPWTGGYHCQVMHKTGMKDPVFGLIYPPNPLGEEVISGDSGSPAFIVLNGELVALNVWSTPRSGYQFYADPIVNDMLTSLGGGYQLTVADMSGFATYSV